MEEKVQKKRSIEKEKKKKKRWKEMNEEKERGVEGRGLKEGGKGD